LIVCARYGAKQTVSSGVHRNESLPYPPTRR
jgi:hypothetical protein